MKIVDILEIADKSKFLGANTIIDGYAAILFNNAQEKEEWNNRLKVSREMEAKLREIFALMPDIIRTVKLSSYHTDYDLEAKLNKWIED